MASWRQLTNNMIRVRMGRGPGWDRATTASHWKAVRLMGWLVFWVSWLTLVGCGANRSSPTLAPTLALPTPSATPSAVPTATRPTPTSFATDFPTWRTATLQDGESFDFRQETPGIPTIGDLYYSAFDPARGTACFWADNVEQVGGRDLGSQPLTASAWPW
jgi:hypothetical protein